MTISFHHRDYCVISTLLTQVLQFPGIGLQLRQVMMIISFLMISMQTKLTDQPEDLNLLYVSDLPDLPVQDRKKARAKLVQVNG